ncbi:hypothetical protein L228DRAFT_266222 [Xylona heveae TC161]|uniref:Only prolin and serin are matching in the corresponding protein n=1 Tax=Xylona heveae (strain CBS 132557 / TC161) TaxID=1328760 RepID=A0A165J5T0_XYLHT|nr:hypothetical protein L228DRAFT_266222 [Xylona heveae TC161]KZF25770.1 hypothetical protein L228DRAFT_266222 [Xylona heveae TC161]
MRELKSLVLPKLVEAKRSSGMVQSEVDSRERSDSVDTLASFRSEYPSPVSPIFSIRGHGRYSSSTSSLASSPTLHDQSDSFVSIKRPLPDLQEEPHEKEDALEMVNVEECFSECFCHQFDCDHHTITLETDYDLDDNPFADEGTSTVKKQHEIGSPLAGLATRISDRFPSFSRRWKSRKNNRETPAVDATSETPASQPISSRSSSLTDSSTQRLSHSDLGSPFTPSASFLEERVDEGSVAPIDIERANRDSDVDAENFASTPLLPPLMLETNNGNMSSVQSPLQSPSVADSRDVYSGCNTPVGIPGTPGMSSPSLSAKPSIASFQKQRTGQFTPTSEIAPIVMADPSDKWADKLGHANFHIQPEPYLPESFDLESCRLFRASWERACCTYLKHLVRTGEHYGVTSKTYKLTEEKWTEIDEDWKKKNEIIASRTPDSMAGTLLSPVQSATMPSPVTSFPSLNDPHSEGKFPKLGDEDIVGPMVQIASQLQRRPSKKAVFLKAVQDIRAPASGVIGRVRSASRSFTT